MSFQKSFAKSSDKSVYPKWIEITLSEEEEKEATLKCRKDNIKIMSQCIEDAKLIVKEKKLFESQKAVTDIASSLFDKRASHEIFYKERKAKEKFDLQNS